MVKTAIAKFIWRYKNMSVCKNPNKSINGAEAAAKELFR